MQLNLIMIKDTDYFYSYRSYKGKLQPLQPNERALSVKARVAVLNDIGSFVNMKDTCEEIFRNFAGWYGLPITETKGN